MVMKPVDPSRAPEGTVTADPAPPSQTYYGIIGTGQSLSQGSSAPLGHDTAPAPCAYKLLDTSNQYDPQNIFAPSLTLGPLTEPFRRDVKTEWEVYPGNIAGGTPHSSMAAQVVKMCRASGRAPVQTVHTTVGKSGAPMLDITKGGRSYSYDGAIFEAKVFKRLLATQRKKLAYSAVILTHGETDAMFGHTTYNEEVRKLRQAFADDLSEITGQQEDVVLILSQQNASPWLPDLGPMKIIQDMWHVTTEDARVICSGPKYQFQYADGLHLNLGGYNRLGEYYGKAYFQQVIQGERFTPLHPKKARRDGRSIVVDLAVPVPPLRWDDLLDTPHQERHQTWAKGRGFEVREQHREKEVEIAAVRIVDATKGQVEISLAEEAPSQRLTLAYAMALDAERPCCGTGEGRMGHVCDSDDTESASIETKNVHLQSQSRSVVCQDGWERRAVWDLVTDVESGEVFTIVDIVAEDKTATLDRAWTGSSGERPVSVQHNLRNYLVSFEMEIE